MIKHFAISIVVAALLDFIWLGFVANRFYLDQLGELARKQDGKIQVVYWAAAGVYLLIALAVTALALPLAGENTAKAFGYGALVGLCIYGVYDLTNHATLVRWPVKLVAADMAWGTFLCASAALAARLIAGAL